MIKIARGTRLCVICAITASAAIAWLPAVAASAAVTHPAGTATTGATANSAAAAAAAAAQAGALTGTVVGPADIPLAGICVTAAGPGGSRVTRTDTSGRYVVAGLPAGSFTVRFADCASPDSYVPEAYAGGPVYVVGGQVSPLAPVVLMSASPMQAIATERSYLRSHPAAAAAAAKHAITGRVRNRAGMPLPGICVTASAIVRYEIGKKYLEFKFPISTKTGSNGRYSIPKLPFSDLAGWQVLFTVGCGNSGNYAPQWWHGAASLGKAATIPAKPHGATITGIDATMTRGASIAGIITGGSATGPGLVGACVRASGRDGQSGVDIGVRTGTGGSYVLHGLGTGSYQVSFGACSAGNYLNRRYGQVSVRVGTTTTVSGFLLPGGTIGGTVTGSQAGSPVLAGICVYLSSSSGLSVATTAKSGSYSFTRLEPGKYYVSLSGGCGNTGSYGAQYYTAAASTGVTSAAAATPISVSLGESVTADVAMLPGGTVTGMTTRQPSGKPLGRVCVQLVAQPGIGFLFVPGSGLPYIFQPFPFLGTISNSAGRYTLRNLNPGLYVAEFVYCGGTAYAGQWFAPEGGVTPQWLSVAGGTVTAGVNAALPRSGGISGTVTSAAGRKLANVCVTAAKIGSPGPLGTVLQIIGGFESVGITGKTGKYHLDGLAPGRYSVEFSSCVSLPRYAPQWFKDKAPGAPATAVTVQPGRTTAGINAALASGKSISGVLVSGITGKPVRGCILAWPGTASQPAFPGIQFATVSKSGRFSFKHVAVGTYQIDASPCFGPSGLAQVRTSIHVPAGSTAAFIVRLPRAGAISGVVSAAGVAGGARLACAEVTGNGETAVTVVGASDTFSVTDLAPGDYQVTVNDSCSGSSALAPKTLSPVTVTGGLTTHVSIALVANGSVTGTVTGSTSSKPLAGICAAAFTNASASQPAAVGISGSAGSYQIGYLPPGSYIVKFSSGCGATGYAAQWYDDATSAATATPVTVPAGGTVGSINATLSS